MLSPETRQTLLVSLQPPEGYELGLAVGTTFSLHLDAALTVPAAFALFRPAAQNLSNLEPLELIESLRRHASRITIFGQAGQIAVPTQRRLFAFLEQSIVAVTAPKGGVFHPKVWVLRYDDGQGQSCFRALIASRNLTHDRSWDTLLRLDSSPSDYDGPTIDGEELTDFVSGLPELAVGAMDSTRRAQIDALAEEIRSAKWSAPQGISGGRIRCLGMSDANDELPFPPSVDRVAVLSPFLTAGLLNRLPRADSKSLLVSTPTSLIGCAAAVAGRFDETYVLDPDATPTVEAAAAVEPALPAGDPNIPLQGLHAKVFVFDHSQGATVVVGSANATTAAFSTNVEVIAELHGPQASIGVESLVGDPKPDLPTLRTYLKPFAIDGTETGDPDDPVADELDRLRRLVASMAIEVRAMETEAEQQFELGFSSLHEAPDVGGAIWTCWPVTLQQLTATQVKAGVALDVRFTVSFEGITSFLAHEIALEGVSTRFVTSGSLVQAPEKRESKLLALLLGDAERFLRYLLMMLADDAVDRLGIGELLDDLDGDPSGKWQGAFDSLPLLEAMLSTLAREPARLRQLKRLFDDLQADEDSAKLFPPGLLELWAPIWDAAQEVLA